MKDLRYEGRFLDDADREVYEHIEKMKRWRRLSRIWAVCAWACAGVSVTYVTLSFYLYIN